MTRDEAVDVVVRERYGDRNLTNEPCRIAAMSDVLILEKLGLLKLEVPKTPWQRFKDSMGTEYDQNDSDPTTVIAEIKQALERANLEIVDRK